jgi:hypothetical protein
VATQGVMYIASGKKYVQAAVRAAQTVQMHSPGLGIHLYTDGQNYDDFKFSDSPFPFTTVGRIDDGHRRSKVDYMSSTPFDRTLYLDTDTSLNADISDMFRVLERFDIALCHALRRNTRNVLDPWRVEIPEAFPQFNSGVILYRKTPAVLQLLEDWGRFYKESGHRHDQPVLRELLWLSDLRIATLPPEYNVRFLKYHFLWTKNEAQTKIFHLKQHHLGWLVWFSKRSGITRIARKTKRLVDKIDRKLMPGRKVVREKPWRH